MFIVMECDVVFQFSFFLELNVVAIFFLQQHATALVSRTLMHFDSLFLGFNLDWSIFD